MVQCYHIVYTGIRTSAHSCHNVGIISADDCLTAGTDQILHTGYLCIIIVKSRFVFELYVHILLQILTEILNIGTLGIGPLIHYHTDLVRVTGFLGICCFRGSRYALLCCGGTCCLRATALCIVSGTTSCHHHNRQYCCHHQADYFLFHSKTPSSFWSFMITLFIWASLRWIYSVAMSCQ